MAMHPRESRYGRREFLGRSAVGVVGLSSLSTILAACGGSDNGNFKPPEPQLARPDSPVTWPFSDDNPMIASGLEPESGTLRIYNWNGYLWPRIKKDFAKEYGVKVEETYFATMDEAISKISSGAVDYDVFFPTPDRLGRLVVGKVLQPLNHDYLPNLANAWPSVQDPWYDKESRYTVPYLTWTTGIGYRADKVAKTPADFSNPYEIYWDEANRGKTTCSTTDGTRRHTCSSRTGSRTSTPRRGSDRPREGRAQIADPRGQREALDGRLHERPRGARVGAPDVVGQRDIGPVVPPGGHGPGGPRLLVPGGWPRHHRQRQHRRPAEREASRARAPLPRLPAR